MSGGTSCGDPSKLNQVASAVNGIANGPVMLATGEFEEAAVGGNPILTTDTAVENLFSPWLSLFTSYSVALNDFATDLGTVANNTVDLSAYATKAAGFRRCVAQLQSAVQRAMAAFQQIDENAAKVINTVLNAASTIVVDTTNIALHANVDASPKGFDNLLALYGDPLKDVVENAEADPEEYESAAIRGELTNGLRELSSSEIETLSKIFKKSPYPQLRDLGDFMEKNPGSQAIQEYLENGGAKTFVAVSVLLNYLKYKDSAPSGVAILEGAATTAVSLGAGTVTGITAATATDFALGGPENPLADVAAVGVGLVTSWFVSKSASSGFDQLNKELFDKGSDGSQSDAPDPLKLGSSPIDAATGN